MTPLEARPVLATCPHCGTEGLFTVLYAWNLSELSVDTLQSVTICPECEAEVSLDDLNGEQ